MSTMRRSESGGQIGRKESPHFIRLLPGDKAEAGLISRELEVNRSGYRDGESASAGVGAILQAASRFREETGRPLSPQDIDEAARRVAGRRRKGAGNG